MIGIILLVSSVGLVAGEAQYFIREPEDITANIGDEVILHCLVGNRQGVLQWTRNGFGLGTEPDLPGFPRYSLTPDLALKISPVSEKDVGEFQCQVGAGETSRPIRSKTAKLSVQLPPGVPKILGGEAGIISVNEGGVGILECESAGGKPAASIDWTEESGKTLKLDSVSTRTIKDEQTQTFKTVSSLRFQVERSMHNKTIVCSAINIVSTEPLKTEVILSVMYRPKVTLGMNAGAGTVKEGENLVLHCQADSNPAPYSYSWKKNGVILPGEMKEYLLLNNIDSSFHSAVVECEARNSLGTAAANRVLNLQYRPVMVVQPRSAAAREGDQVTLRCRANSNPPPRYVWLKDANPQPIEFSDTINIVVSSFSAGKYRCQALVEGFETVESKPATVSILEKPKIQKMETKFGVVGTDVELMCPVVSPSQPINITWYYKGRGPIYIFNHYFAGLQILIKFDT